MELENGPLLVVVVAAAAAATKVVLVVSFKMELFLHRYYESICIDTFIGGYCRGLICTTKKRWIDSSCLCESSALTRRSGLMIQSS